jgi:hypothetical protein
MDLVVSDMTFLCNSFRHGVVIGIKSVSQQKEGSNIFEDYLFQLFWIVWICWEFSHVVEYHLQSRIAKISSFGACGLTLFKSSCVSCMCSNIDLT